MFEQAFRSSDKALTALARASQPAQGARLGLAISKKCARRSVDRQRIKRLIRESFRQTRQQLPAMDIVVMCRPAVLSMSNHEISKALDRHWQRLTRQCEES